jgi:DNA-binding transcriptional LysR family regulator
MEITTIKSFFGDCRNENFYGRRALMNVTQAAISMQIRQLEDEVGLPLFTRTPRRVILTEAGESCSTARGRSCASMTRRSPRSPRSRAPNTAGCGSVRRARCSRPSNCPEFSNGSKQKFPNAEVTVSSGTSQVLVEKIMHGEIDIAFVSLPVETSNVQTELLFSDEIVAIAHPGHPLGEKNASSARRRSPANI